MFRAKGWGFGGFELRKGLRLGVLCKGLRVGFAMESGQSVLVNAYP